MEILVVNENSVDLRSAASDLGLHCLLITLFEISRLKWVNLSDLDRKSTDVINVIVVQLVDFSHCHTVLYKFG